MRGLTTEQLEMSPMQTNPFARLRAISYRLTWVERFVAVSSGISLTCALVIAGASTAYFGHFPAPLLSLITFAWVLFTVLAVDTQLIGALGACVDSHNALERFWWVVVVVVLILPAAVVNDVFAQTTAGLAATDTQALAHLHITPLLWTHGRALYGIVLLCISRLTRPYIERKIAEPVTIPPALLPAKKPAHKRPQRASPSRPRLRKREEVAMTLWREAQAERLYNENNRITMRGLASGLTWTHPETGIAYPCHHETAAGLLRTLRSRPTIVALESEAA